MDMQQIERSLFGHFSHFCRQRQRVGWVIEQRIRSNFHFVKKNPFVRDAQPDRHGVTDEMNLMPARRQFNPKLRGDHARAAIRRIACDSDFHGRALLSVAQPLGTTDRLRLPAPLRRRPYIRTLSSACREVGWGFQFASV